MKMAANSSQFFNCSDVVTYSDGNISWINFTVNDSQHLCDAGGDDVMQAPIRAPSASLLDYVLVTLFGIICFIGLLGNALVIYVIAGNKNMKTVTNYLILNLSVADSLFLIVIPMAMTTSILKYWIFGEVLCKAYYILTCINQFTGAFTLTAMSGDRFLAVCYPIAARGLRTTKNASVALAIIWIASLVFITPIMLYAGLVQHGPYSSCTIMWPAKQRAIGIKTFTIYTLLLGFAIPVAGITVMYTLLVVRLRRPVQTIDERSKKRTRTVTKLVTLIISVFIVCWLPHWTLQVYLISAIPRSGLARYLIYLFQASTVLSYANSMVNPIIYAFTNRGFRDAFMAVFHCVSGGGGGGGQRKSRGGGGSRAAASECLSLVNKPSGKRKQQQLLLQLQNGSSADDVICAQSHQLKTSNGNNTDTNG